MKEVLYFTSEDCIACESMKPHLEYICNNKDIKIKEIDPTEHPEIASKYDVSILPTVVYNDNKIDGYATISMMEELFR